MSDCFYAAFEGVRHLFFRDGWAPGNYWPACGCKHSVGHFNLTPANYAPELEPCGRCDDYVWRERVRTDGWAARCGIGDPHFPAPITGGDSP